MEKFNLKILNYKNKWNKDINLKVKVLKFVEENIKLVFLYIWVSINFRLKY